MLKKEIIYIDELGRKCADYSKVKLRNAVIKGFKRLLLATTCYDYDNNIISLENENTVVEMLILLDHRASRIELPDFTKDQITFWNATVEIRKELPFVCIDETTKFLHYDRKNNNWIKE